MARFGVWLSSCALVLLIMIAPVWAQTLPLSSSAVTDKLARPAGMIFSGAVVRIERVAVSDGEPASIRITLRVEEALRGCTAGETIEFAEWAELWVRSDRYRVGQKLLLFLYPRNAAGISAPVAGEMGVFLVAPGGLLRLTPQQAFFLSSQPGGRPSLGESPYPTQTHAGLRSIPLRKRELVDRIRGAE